MIGHVGRVYGFVASVGWFALGFAACAQNATTPAGKPAAAAAGQIAATADAAGGIAAAAKSKQPPLVPPLTLIPAGVARQNLVASFLVPALDRTVENGVALVRQASPLPLDAANVRDMLLAQLGLPVEISKHLDLRQAIAGAAVAGKPGTPPLIAFSIAAKGPSDVAALMSAAGQVIGRRGTAVQIQAPGGERGWFLPVGNVLVIADSDDALTMAGQLALEGRGAGKDDISVLVFPDALARATGTTVRSELDRLLLRIESAQPAPGHGARSPAAAADRSRQLREFADYLTDAGSAEFAMNVDPGRGLGVMLRLSPRSGTKLEALAQEVRTVALDPLVGDESENPAAVLTSAYGQRNIELLRRQRAKLSSMAATTGVGAAHDVTAAGRLLDAMIVGLSGDMSAVFRLRPALSGDVVYPAVSDEGAKAIAVALAGMNKPAMTAWLRSSLDKNSIEFKVVTARTESVGKQRALHSKVVLSAPGSSSKKIVERLVGAKGLDMFASIVAGNRLAITFGQGARARLAGMAAGRSAIRTTALSNALLGSGARSIFASVDLREVIRFGLTMSEDQRARAIGDTLTAPMPVMGGVAGDATKKQLTVDLLVPPSCFAGMTGLVQAAMMMRR